MSIFRGLKRKAATPLSPSQTPNSKHPGHGASKSVYFYPSTPQSENTHRKSKSTCLKYANLTPKSSSKKESRNKKALYGNLEDPERSANIVCLKPAVGVELLYTSTERYDHRKSLSRNDSVKAETDRSRNPKIDSRIPTPITKSSKTTSKRGHSKSTSCVKNISIPSSTVYDDSMVSPTPRSRPRGLTQSTGLSTASTLYPDDRDEMVLSGKFERLIERKITEIIRAKLEFEVPQMINEIVTKQLSKMMTTEQAPETIDESELDCAPDPDPNNPNNESQEVSEELIGELDDINVRLNTVEEAYSIHQKALDAIMGMFDKVPSQ